LNIPYFLFISLQFFSPYSSQQAVWLYGGPTNIYPAFGRYSASVPADGKRRAKE